MALFNHSGTPPADNLHEKVNLFDIYGKDETVDNANDVDDDDDNGDNRDNGKDEMVV
ncbi:hypothetical protein DDB_G0275387 [Dictyostelium discoideum AX4]|uniref:Uncharacterized protein n=1 Tax=Dictyostelium discoideum TaxID=44689 RepID=Q553P0_DICDI|nr:hypothetical protein DDB_G0275387 [Dictyostelium discoideum AX4]EAL69759.1 hypothetical protein DDB_G0275387 [Dictyostelium discoideum AX4]|eukprot:XP_643706.1 hypothetical protein DDB_G0275387 [Dictyostelium discoideum AX4]